MLEEDVCPDCDLHTEAIARGLTASDRVRCKQPGARHVWILDTGEHVCCLCGLMGGPKRVDEYRADRLIRRHDTYQPNEYIDGKCLDLAGMQDRPVSFTALQGLFVKHIGCKTWFDVHDLTVSLGIAADFLRVPALLGHPIAAAVWKRHAMQIIYEDRFPFRLKFTYIAVKLTQLFCPEPVRTDRNPVAVPQWRWIPLKVKKTTHTANENKWKTVCSELGLPFVRIPFSQLVTPWTVV